MSLFFSHFISIYNFSVFFFNSKLLSEYSDCVGPDQIRPSDNYYSTEANGAVKLRDNVQLNDTMSFPTMLKRAAENYPNHPAIRYYPDKTTLVTVTYL